MLSVARRIREVIPLRKFTPHFEACCRERVTRKTLESLLRGVVIVFAANCLKAWQTHEELRGDGDEDNPRVNIEL